MASDGKTTAVEFEVLATARDLLRDAGHGARSQVIADLAKQLGVSHQTAYRRLQEAGFDSGRKRRTDAGESLLTAAQIGLVAGVLQTTTNQKGQRMPLNTAVGMLQASGQLPPGVSVSTVGRQLRQRMLHPDLLALPTPSVQLASRHPNHVWQVDSTTGAYYYLPGGRLRWMPEDQFYKNKVENLVRASKDLLTRYAATDHTSGAFRMRYYLGGESAATLVDFMCWAMWRDAGSVMHGVPQIVMMDPGPGNKSQLFLNFAKRLGMDPRHHAPGAARVTGSVEKSHDLARMHFETRLRFVDPAQVTLDWLNHNLAVWAAAHCASRVHGRHGMTRFDAWLRITPAQLRVPASLQALRDAAVREPERRRVSNTKTVSYAGREYDLSLVPGIVAGLPVVVVENVFRAPAIDVLHTDADTGAETWHVVEPMTHDEWGFRTGAPVIGEEMRTAAFSEVDRARGQLQQQAYRTGDGLPTQEEAKRLRKGYAQAYAGVVDAMADVNATQVPTYLPRAATPLPVAQRQVEARRISVVDACAEIKRRIGAAYTPQVYADLTAEFTQGVPEEQLDGLVARYGSAAPAPHAAAGGE